jgi:glutamate-1-semialdehyde 2,1-aminomutase
MGSGPMILGHAHPEVVAAVREQIGRGSTFYGLNDLAIGLAEAIVGASPCAEALKFCSSGAEATFYALRLARAATGRPKILKFEGGYHGHHDYAMMSVTPARPVPFPTPVPDSAGIPESVEREVLVAPFNDLAATRQIIDRHGSELAAVIVEPLSRMLEPQPGFLEGLRDATRRQGVVLIFDEVVTGFTPSSRTWPVTGRSSAAACRSPPSPAAAISWSSPTRARRERPTTCMLAAR